MAKQHYGINGGYRGAVGTVIGYEWNGRWCLRSRPRRVHNPRTERQQQLRQLCAYMEEHVDSWQSPRSLDVLMEVFD